MSCWYELSSLFQKKFFIYTIERKTFQDHAFFALIKIVLLVQSNRSVGFTVLWSASVYMLTYIHTSGMHKQISHLYHCCHMELFYKVEMLL